MEGSQIRRRLYVSQEERELEAARMFAQGVRKPLEYQRRLGGKKNAWKSFVYRYGAKRLEESKFAEAASILKDAQIEALQGQLADAKRAQAATSSGLKRMAIIVSSRGSPYGNLSADGRKERARSTRAILDAAAKGTDEDVAENLANVLTQDKALLSATLKAAHIPAQDGDRKRLAIAEENAKLSHAQISELSKISNVLPAVREVLAVRDALELPTVELSKVNVPVSEGSEDGTLDHYGVRIHLGESLRLLFRLRGREFPFSGKLQDTLLLKLSADGFKETERRSSFQLCCRVLNGHALQTTVANSVCNGLLMSLEPSTETKAYTQSLFEDVEKEVKPLLERGIDLENLGHKEVAVFVSVDYSTLAKLTNTAGASGVFFLHTLHA